MDILNEDNFIKELKEVIKNAICDSIKEYGMDIEDIEKDDVIDDIMEDINEFVNEYADNSIPVYDTDLFQTYADDISLLPYAEEYQKDHSILDALRAGLFDRITERLDEIINSDKVKSMIDKVFNSIKESKGWECYV